MTAVPTHTPATITTISMIQINEGKANQESNRMWEALMPFLSAVRSITRIAFGAEV